MSHDLDDGVLTWGLNMAMKAGHLDIARSLLGVGVKWGSVSVRNACRSLEAVKLLFEVGLSVNDPYPTATCFSSKKLPSSSFMYSITYTAGWSHAMTRFLFATSCRKVQIQSRPAPQSSGAIWLEGKTYSKLRYQSRGCSVLAHP
jgi:hypothetical protein